MASIQTGVAVIFGFPGAVTFTSGAGTYFKDSGDISNDIKIDEIRDEDNEWVGAVHSGETFEMTLMFTPKADTLANAKKMIAPPAKGSAVLLSAFNDDADGAVINGSWLYVGSWKVAFKKDGIATYELKLRRGSATVVANVNAGVQLAIV